MRLQLAHDMAVFVAAGDLMSGSFEIISAKDPTHVCWAWDFELPDARADDRTLDDVREPEFRDLISDVGEVRFAIKRRGRESLYAGNKLLGNWKNAEAKIRAGGSTRDDRDALRGTGGRLKARSWSSDTNKVELEIYKLDDGGYGFARSREGVQVHVDRREFAGGGLPWTRWRALRPGTKVRALLVPCRRKKDGTPSVTAQAVELVI
jgi:hypothetical protein